MLKFLKILPLIVLLVIATPVSTLRAAGEAYYRYPTAPAGGLTILCYEEDRFSPDDFLGYGVTKADGTFNMTLDSTETDWWGEMDVFCELGGFDLLIKIRTKTLEPDTWGVVNFGPISVYRNRVFKGCNANGCGPVVNGYNLDWIVPDLDFSEACLSHDCCLMQCYKGQDSPDGLTCNKEFDEVLLANCMLSDIPMCRQLAAIYSHAVNNWGVMEHWCDLQKKYCGAHPPMCVKEEQTEEVTESPPG